MRTDASSRPSAPLDENRSKMLTYGSWIRLAAVLLVSCSVIYFLLAMLLDGEFHTKKSVKQDLTLMRRDPHIRELMHHLGFNPSPKLYPQSHHEEFEDLPVFVAAAESSSDASFVDFIISQRMYFPDKKLVVYSLDLDKDHIIKIRDVCRCVVRHVRWQHYPEHIRDSLQLNLVRPLIIQEALMEFGAIFWCDRGTRFITSEVWQVLSQAERVGIVGWPIAPPTSAITHPAMFNFFNASEKEYRYLRPVRSSELVIYNTELVHDKIMRPWIQCVLNPNCIAPSGGGGRDSNVRCGKMLDAAKTGHSYAGCHFHDLSALNVVLGKVYNYETPYASLMDMFTIERNLISAVDWFS